MRVIIQPRKGRWNQKHWCWMQHSGIFVCLPMRQYNGFHLFLVFQNPSRQEYFHICTVAYVKHNVIEQSAKQSTCIADTILRTTNFDFIAILLSNYDSISLIFLSFTIFFHASDLNIYLAFIVCTQHEWHSNPSK